MTIYQVRGLHCKSCGQNFLDNLKELPQGEEIKFDGETLEIPEEMNLDYVNRIAGANKLILVSPNQTENEHHHNHSTHHHEITGPNDSTKMLIVFFINLSFSLAEFFFGILFNSAAILSDAVHDFGDALAMGVAWFLEKTSNREADSTYSIGYERFSILGALITSLVLVIGSIGIINHAIPRFFNPEPAYGAGMFWLGIIAIIINGLAAWLLSKGRSANERVLSLHLLEDVLGWVGVIVVGVVLHFTDWYWLDPLLSLVIAGFILSQALKNLWGIGKVLLEAVPEGIDIQKLSNQIMRIDGVNAIRHLHIWSLDGENNVFVVTLYTDLEGHAETERIRKEVRQLLADLSVGHSTIEVVHDFEKIIKN